MEHEHELVEQEFEVFDMVMEDGTTVEFAILDYFDMDDKGYVVVAPSVALDEGTEGEAFDIFFYRYYADVEEVEFIEDEAEYRSAAAFYDALCEAEEDECDCDGGCGCGCGCGHCDCE